MDEKYGFVYIWYDRKHKRYYVGCHWGHVNDGYICSSSWMIQAYRIRPDDFKRRILKTRISTREATYVEEQRYLNMIKPAEIKPANETPRYYNLCTTNNEVWHKYPGRIKTVGATISAAKKSKNIRYTMPEERKKAISEAKKAAFMIKPYPHDSERVIAANNARIGRQSPRKGKTHTDESKEKMRQASLGKVASEETRKKIGDAHRGMKRTDETKQNIRKAVSKQYRITFTDGQELIVNGLKSYALANDISYTSLHKAYLEGTSRKRYNIEAINSI